MISLESALYYELFRQNENMLEKYRLNLRMKQETFVFLRYFLKHSVSLTLNVDMTLNFAVKIFQLLCETHHHCSKSN